MTQAEILEAARQLIAKMTDANKWTLLRDQLEGDLCFDSQDAMDVISDVYDAYRASFERIDEAVDASMVEPSDTYISDVAFDYHTAQAGNGYYA